MLRERCNPNPDGDIEGGPKPTEKIIIKYLSSTYSNLLDSGRLRIWVLDSIVGKYIFPKIQFHNK